MNELETLQQNSVQQYQEFHALTLALEEPLQRLDVAGILQLTRRIEALKKEVRSTDAQINEAAPAGHEGNRQLQAERLELMQKIRSLNARLMPRIQAMMAVQASELSRIKNGMNSLGGYGNAAPRSGKIINTAN